MLKYNMEKNRIGVEYFSVKMKADKNDRAIATFQ